ncbi:MAG: hypothetical protein P8Z75_06770 [Gammaproteobacteria bacterium]|jgi:hypothetical protein
MNYDPLIQMSEEKYRVMSVKKTRPPEGMPDVPWHRYVIGYGQGKINGMKPGTLNAVTQHAQAVAESLNQRAKCKGSIYAPRSRK